jgi:hypothetical protein
MNITPIAFAVLLAGIPAFAGAYLFVGYFGHKKMSAGISILVFGLAVGFTIVYFMPEARFSRGGDHRVTVPWVLVISIVAGAIVGFVSRCRGKHS